MPPDNSYLIIAQSGRSLAASAKKAGIQTHVIDRFGDTDTKNYALSTRIVNGNDSEICIDHLRLLLAEFNPDEIKGVITGSGFENQPEVLNEIDEQFTLLGNSAECVRACKDPNVFFPMLESHGIPYPEISFNLLDEQAGWLVKKVGGTGGQHISWANDNELSYNHYFQKYMNGKNLSVTFIANGQEACVVGFNETWSQDAGKNNFRHQGAVATFKPSQNIKNQFYFILSKLVKELRLFGICGLDTIVDLNDVCHVLEVNPRAVATIDLYEHQNLFQAHLESCEGKLSKLTQNDINYCGYQIYYSNNQFTMPDIQWPDWIVDRPQSGARIASGEPICTIRAVTATPVDTKKLLDQRQLILLELFTTNKVAA